jgi:valyl-tRNA synthetase
MKYKTRTTDSLPPLACSRSKDIIEPLPIPQWFCDCDAMAARGLKAVETGELRLIPSSFNKTWEYWLGNIRPWCISRQLWWGHRIPAYFVTINDGKTPAAQTTDNKVG